MGLSGVRKRRGKWVMERGVESVFWFFVRLMCDSSAD